MSAAPAAHTLTDPARMRVLAAIDFDNPALRAGLNHVAEDTAQATGMPISLVTLVLDTSQLFAGSTSLDGCWIAAAGGTPIEWSFCVNTVTTGQPYVIPDMAASTHAANPLVTVDNVASYAGVPIVLAGQTVGAHCIIGVTAQQFTADQLQQLHTGAQQAGALLQQFSNLT
ncbi:histidine kinase [Actinoplanes sp. SE50]|uniref:GAF domain-containing protein n=1 Tax=unclassified Actinoplanes TaxID=2626549 RepID=UPI00023ED684|nr:MULTISPECIES: GAF domain-containing protein [unclassified Actinoplanes]AEV86793.1 putative GAF sensor protein [Actinoplanes sp. SE50/110]ATO85190.1 histidine kinase [Actinoplanes sp. SE50]SLM02600.1 histidine kinase [Actinoplanes sp. SE50/110]